MKPTCETAGPAALIRFVGVLCLALGALLPAVAHADQNCTWTDAGNPLRQIISCGAALTVEREAQTEITITERAGDAAPRTIDIRNGAILIQVAPGSLPTQIRTPHAIAAVRGTTYVVDARADSTSVFVLEGEVAVRKTDQPEAVALQAGEGIDVSSDAALDIQVWDQNRTARLLARFGR